MSLLGVGSRDVIPSRQLYERIASSHLGCLEVVFCRGRDLANHVAHGYLDLAFTGYDAWSETLLRFSGLRRKAMAWHVGSERPGRLSLVSSATAGSIDYDLVWTEYPALTEAYLSSIGFAAEVVPVRGSIEGMAFVSDRAGCVVTVSSGETLQANGLIERHTILTTDLCMVVAPAHSDRPELISLLKGHREAELPTFFSK